MIYPIETVGASGLTLYAILHHPDGRVWNTSSLEWETFNASNWTLYAIPLIEQGATGYYKATFPGDITDALVTEAIYNQAGANPSIAADAPSIGLGQCQGTAIIAIGDSLVAADNLKENLKLIVQGAAVAGTLTTTKMTTNLADTTDDIYVGRLIMWSSGALLRKGAYIIGYNGTTKMLTFGAVSVAPVAGNSFLII